jgi:hypothetical protein
VTITSCSGTTTRCRCSANSLPTQAVMATPTDSQAFPAVNRRATSITGLVTNLLTMAPTEDNGDNTGDDTGEGHDGGHHHGDKPLHGEHTTPAPTGGLFRRLTDIGIIRKFERLERHIWDVQFFWSIN